MRLISVNREAAEPIHTSQIKKDIDERKVKKKKANKKFCTE